MSATPPPSALPARWNGRAAIDSPAAYRSGRELLSLALIDARNRTLQWLALYEEALGSPRLPLPSTAEGVDRPLWLAGHIGWFAEWWIGRNVQCSLGAECPARPTRLSSIERRADGWWSDRRDPAATLPELGEVRAYLLETLEATLELLDKAAETDAGLYFYRAALAHEDLRCEQWMVMAQTLSLALPAKAEALCELPVAPAPREALLLPATKWQLGARANGFVFAQETGTLTIDVPEFEIDAQAVTWSQYLEFVDDGGYDREAFWSVDGWLWLARQAGQGRRGPRHIEQISVARSGTGTGGAALQSRFGRLVRLAGQQAAVHVSWWEADAWARWAGRRLATEVEWEIACHTASGRGFRWGEVHEWTAGMLRPWSGFRADPWSEGGVFDPQPAFGQARVLRGASFATPARLASPQRRGFAWPGSDAGFLGFRTCAA